MSGTLGRWEVGKVEVIRRDARGTYQFEEASKQRSGFGGHQANGG
ncbi:MAG TPA: hypothetical protein VIT88_01180 [Pyrinomonadaceae bacterium]